MPLRLERSESAASLESLLAGASPFGFKADKILKQKIKKLKKMVDNLKNLLYNNFCVREKVM